MEFLPRHVEDRLAHLGRRFPVIALLGGRQVGKSTLLREVLGDRARTVVFDPVQDIGRARADPELFLRLNPPPLVLDEVQNAPELLAAVKRAVDERPGETGLYFLTGSQQLNMLGRVQESLAGRVALVDLFPMTFRELAGQGESTLLLETVLAQPEADAG